MRARLEFPGTIKGDGIHLRRFSLADIDAVLDAAKDPYSFRGFNVPTDGDRANAARYVGLNDSAWNTGYVFPLAIVDDASGKTVGMRQIGALHYFQGRVTVGCWVAPSFRRNGYSLRSMNAVTKWLGEQPGVYRVDAFVEMWNTASCAVLERAGFEREGVLRNWEVLRGKPRDMFSYVWIPDNCAETSEEL